MDTSSGRPSILLLSLLLGTACGRSYGEEEKTPAVGEAYVDAAVSDRVRGAILADSSLRAEAETVRVSTQAGVVTLAGSVRTAALRERMQVVVRAVGSVVRVDNRLVVDPEATGERETMETTVDHLISDRVRLALSDDPSLAREAEGVRVLTKEGVVALTGEVGSVQAKERMGVIAAAVGSVVRVDNELAVRRP